MNRVSLDKQIVMWCFSRRESFVLSHWGGSLSSIQVIYQTAGYAQVFTHPSQDKVDYYCTLRMAKVRNVSSKNHKPAE